MQTKEDEREFTEPNVIEIMILSEENRKGEEKKRQRGTKGSHSDYITRSIDLSLLFLLSTNICEIFFLACAKEIRL